MPKIGISEVKKIFENIIDAQLLSLFESALTAYSRNINKAVSNGENEEYIKSIIRDFLRENFYSHPKFVINTDRNIDSTIKENDKLLAIMETKKPSNTGEMISYKNINKKALWESIYYFLEKTIDVSGSKPKPAKNSEIRRLVITDGLNWFLFDAHDVYGIIKGELEKQYYKYKNGQLIYKNNPEFYAVLGQYFDEINITEELDFVYFNIQDCLNNKSYIANIYNLLSESYLLKNTFQKSYEPNALNSEFYHELLYIMGLRETAKNGKPIVEIDKSITNSLAHQVYEFLHAKEIAENEIIEYTFELVLIWVNRFLFIKLFEGQLISFNNSDDCYNIINHDKISTFKDVDNLFFEILGKKERSNTTFFNNFTEVPYLNSSLFEKQEIEKKYLFISYLENSKIKRKSKSVLGKNAKKELFLLEYIIDFLNSYNFSSDIDSDNNLVQSKQIIDAAVLGLIFEKLNGYKDGAFFTPAVITEYMCKKVIENVILDKINTVMKWNCKDLADVADKIETLDERKKINAAINSLKICDPSVGSGHFLVSALNRIIAVKMKLKVLFKYNSDERLKEVQIYVENDVLTVKNGNGELFSYNKNDNESREIQETLFNEKRIIIENCLFGVDINPKAVHIAQLRLWIELLKNAYYKDGVMETLPNIDINIKVGNSLISKIDFSIGKKIVADKDTKELIARYKALVMQYKSVSNKADKNNLVIELKTTKSGIHEALHQFDLFDAHSDDNFEWAFEFPEILDENGNFLGFDVMIGNPPYVNATEMFRNNPKEREAIRESKRFLTLHQKWDLYIPFIELGLQLLKIKGNFTMIVPLPFVSQMYAKKLRELVIKDYNIVEIADLSGTKIFENATVSNCILFLINDNPTDSCYISNINEQKQISRTFKQPISVLVQDEKSAVWNLAAGKRELSSYSQINVLGDFCYISKGMVLNSDEKTAKGEFTKKNLIKETYDDIFCKKYIEAKDIEKYCVKNIRYLEYNTDRCPTKLSRPTFRELYETPKILINKLGKLKATFDAENFYCDQTIRICILWKNLKSVENKSINNSVKRYANKSRSELELISDMYDEKFLLGILNSTMGNYLLDTIRGENNIDINPDYLKNIPIPYASKEKHNNVVGLVNQILSAKQSDPAADTSALEAEIDRMVYELYGLTEDEIKIVEGAV